MLETLNEWDQQLMLILNGDGGPFWDQVWYIYSGKFTWIPLYAILLWVLFKRCRSNKYIECWRHFSTCVFCIVLLIVLSDQISSGLIKPLVCRPRPSHEPGLMDLLHYVNDYHGGAYGFVSSHAANSLAAALWLGWLLWGKKPEIDRLTSQLNINETDRNTTTYKYGKLFQLLLLIWALFNCYSRVYLGVHYPGDILGGWIIGILSFLIVKMLYIYIIRKILFPKI